LGGISFWNKNLAPVSIYGYFIMRGVAIGTQHAPQRRIGRSGLLLFLEHQGTISAAEKGRTRVVSEKGKMIGEEAESGAMKIKNHKGAPRCTKERGLAPPVFD
jgi:ribosomal protein S19E (S16A)